MTSCLKFPQGFSNRFPVNRGTRQGDIFSSALFNLLVNDVVSAVTNPTPALLDGCSVTILLYADDLILLLNFRKEVATLPKFPLCLLFTVENGNSV
jgi:hypothetical protein